MKVSAATAGQFIDWFRSETPENRVELLAHVLAGSRASYGCVVPVAATCPVDPDAFVRGLLVSLERDPANLPALRILSWHYTRQGEWDNTRGVLRAFIAHWPGMMDTRRELVRVNLLSPRDDGDQVLQQAGVELDTDLARLAYKSQHSLAVDQQVPDDIGRDLRRHIKQSCARILDRSGAADPVLPADKASLFLQIIEKIISAGSIALVGNGASLRGSGAGPAIDRHDLVIRCNFPRFRPFRDDVGEKLDIVFFNESLFGQLEPLLGQDQAYQDCLALAFHPDENPLFAPAIYRAPAAHQASRISSELRAFYRGLFYDRPTTGMMAILFLAIGLRKTIDIYGFDFYKGNAVHYFPSNSPVFLGHELQYENWFLDNFIPVLGFGSASAAAL